MDDILRSINERHQLYNAYATPQVDPWQFVREQQYAPEDTAPSGFGFGDYVSNAYANWQKNRYSTIKDSALGEYVKADDLRDKPLIVSAQKTDSWPMAGWFMHDMAKLNIVATYNLVFNASLMVSEGLGYALCFDKLINVSGESTLCFRPLYPKMESEASIIWKRYQLFSKAAQKFIDVFREYCEL